MTPAVRSADELAALLRPAPFLLIVPPFAWLDRPALGVHLLQALARAHGHEVQVLYANVWFAAWFGEAEAVALSRTQYSLFLGERLFARAAFATPPLGHDRGASIDEVFAVARDEALRLGRRFMLTREQLVKLESRIAGWLDTFVPHIAARRYQVVGCTTSFEQTAASITILDRIKQAAPATFTAIGGANCEGEMARGIAALSAHIDGIFSGESERTFVALLDTLQRGDRPASRIHVGEPCMDLDALPVPDYADYYAQVRALLPTSRLLDTARVAYESSRGCWWGEKHHCTFCGLNGQGMASRAKSPERVFADLRQLLAAHPNREVVMTDNIMPHAYWKTFVPRLPQELPGVRMMYELKANVTFDQVRALAAAGIREIQPGIEALSTGLLELMDKGTTCAQNIALLRYGRITGMRLHWNLLAGFPGDQRAFYEETLELLPLLVHLPPPFRLNRVIFDRFSPYHAHPGRYGVHDLRAIAPYRAWLPEGAPLADIAYHFDATFESGALASPELLEAIDERVRAWRQRWVTQTPPELTVRHGEFGYELVDTRGVPGLPDIQPIDEHQALAALVARPLSAPERAGDAWARAQRVVVERDGKQVPLAVAPAELLADFEARAKAKDRRVLVTLAS